MKYGWIVLMVMVSLSQSFAAGRHWKDFMDTIDQRHAQQSEDLEQEIRVRKQNDTVYREIKTPYLNLLIEFMKWAKGNVDVRSYSPVALEILERYEQLVQRSERLIESGDRGSGISKAILSIVVDNLRLLREYTRNIEEYNPIQSNIINVEFEGIRFITNSTFPQLIIPRKE
jgi:hypothetical protein